MTTLPLVALTPWRQVQPTYVHPRTHLSTLDRFYTDSVVDAGGLPLMVPAALDRPAAQQVVSSVDALIITGGPDVDPALYGHQNTASVAVDRSADESDMELTRAALEVGLPILAICRGAQILNVACGGTLHQHIWERSSHPSRPDTGDIGTDADAALAQRHPVTFTVGSLAADVYGTTEISVNSLHHQSVDRPGDGLTVTGIAPDDVAEVIEHENGRTLGVQWHPERLGTEDHGMLFHWLLTLAKP